MKESALKDRFKQAMTEQGALHRKQHGSRASMGRADHYCTCPVPDGHPSHGRFLAVELKTLDGRQGDPITWCTPLQKKDLREVAQAGGVALVLACKDGKYLSQQIFYERTFLESHVTRVFVGDTIIQAINYWIAE